MTVFYCFSLSFIMGLDWTRRISFREHSILCIRRMWVDRPGVGLPIFPNPCFGPNELPLFGLLWKDTAGARTPLLFWVGEWNTWPSSISPSSSMFGSSKYELKINKSTKKRRPSRWSFMLIKNLFVVDLGCNDLEFYVR